MNKNAPTNPIPADAEPPVSAGKPWSLRARLLVSALLLFQVTAVLYGPLSMPPTITADALRPILRPYTGATYQGNSYKFFSPDPGPSHLIRYELELAGGSKETGVFPNLEQEWPRLLYHRHFMLTEHLNQNTPPPGPDEPPTDWEKMKNAPGQLRVAQSYADHLLHKYDDTHEDKARSVTLWLIQHTIPTPEQAARGMTLTDPSLYHERRLGSFAGNP
jgi:hypothetical protein